MNKKHDLQNLTVEALNKLVQSDIKINLTGSRFMKEKAKAFLEMFPVNTIVDNSTSHVVIKSEDANMLALAKDNPDADYDYVVQYNHQLEKKLTDLGFLKIEQSSCYYGTDTVAVYELGKVQIILKEDAELYLKVFNKLPVTTYANYLWKSAPFPFSYEKDKLRSMIINMFSFAMLAAKK